jgi:hypothetical protein
MTTAEALATVREALPRDCECPDGMRYHALNCPDRPGALNERAALALIEQRIEELEKERDHYRFHFDQQEQRAEAAESRLAAYERVVEAARLAYDGFGEDDHEFYGSQKRLAAALAALKEQA